MYIWVWLTVLLHIVYYNAVTVDFRLQHHWHFSSVITGSYWTVKGCDTSRSSKVLQSDHPVLLIQLSLVGPGYEARYSYASAA